MGLLAKIVLLRENVSTIVSFSVCTYTSVCARVRTIQESIEPFKLYI